MVIKKNYPIPGAVNTHLEVEPGDTLGVRMSTLIVTRTSVTVLPQDIKQSYWETLPDRDAFPLDTLYLVWDSELQYNKPSLSKLRECKYDDDTLTELAIADRCSFWCFHNPQPRKGSGDSTSAAPDDTKAALTKTDSISAGESSTATAVDVTLPRGPGGMDSADADVVNGAHAEHLAEGLRDLRVLQAELDTGAIEFAFGYSSP